MSIPCDMEVELLPQLREEGEAEMANDLEHIMDSYKDPTYLRATCHRCGSTVLPEFEVSHNHHHRTLTFITKMLAYQHKRLSGDVGQLALITKRAIEALGGVEE